MYLKIFRIIFFKTFSAKSPDLARLPEAWLREVLVEIKKTDSDLDLCATRRSAGLPHYIKVSCPRTSKKVKKKNNSHFSLSLQAIVGSQQVTSNRTTLQLVMSSLLSVASEAVVESSVEENFTLVSAEAFSRGLRGKGSVEVSCR